MRIALGIEYDGRNFDGWQTQPSGNTVQDHLQKAIFSFTGEKLNAVCAGRTDADVHASGQVAHIDTLCQRKEVSWVRGLNSFLPKSIAVRWAKEVPENFHARFSAVSRTYEYWISNEPVRSPLLDGRTGWVFRPLDAESMQLGADYLLGTHDFTSFRASGCQSKTPVKTVASAKVKRFGRLICLRISADAFLYHMVRNIVGSLIYVGTGVRPPEWIAELIEARDRSIGAPTFYPSGLYLTGVGYPEEFQLPPKAESPFSGFWTDDNQN